MNLKWRIVSYHLSRDQSLSFKNIQSLEQIATEITNYGDIQYRIKLLFSPQLRLVSWFLNKNKQQERRWIIWAIGSICKFMFIENFVF